MESPANIPGVVSEGGWLVDEKHRELLARLRAAEPPRDYGPLDQLKLDLTTSRSRWVYLVCLGFLVAGIAFSDWALIVLALSMVAFFAGGFMTGVRIARHGKFATIRISEIQREIGKSQGMNEGVLVDGRPMTVSFDLPSMKAALARYGDVEVEVLFEPNAKKPAAFVARMRVPQGG